MGSHCNGIPFNGIQSGKWNIFNWIQWVLVLLAQWIFSFCSTVDLKWPWNFMQIYEHPVLTKRNLQWDPIEDVWFSWLNPIEWAWIQWDPIGSQEVQLKLIENINGTYTGFNGNFLLGAGHRSFCHYSSITLWNSISLSISIKWEVWTCSNLMKN